ncbi:hypothetical protein JW906_00595 [bacterium]|nr:hypothetical protein [bacterium]
MSLSEKTAFCILALLAASGCSDMARDNALDPKNPDGSRPLVILLEAFVNTGSPLSDYNRFMIQALDSLESLYPERMEIVHYHRHAGSVQDPYHLIENEILYDRYTGSMSSGVKGVPDVFINGTTARVQGASSVETAFRRLQENVLGLLPCSSLWTMEAGYSLENGKIVPEIVLARLGDSEATGVRVRAVLTSRLDGPTAGHVAKGSSESAVIDRLEGGEIRTLRLPEIPLNGTANAELILVVTDRDGLRVEQCGSLQIR